MNESKVGSIVQELPDTLNRDCKELERTYEIALFNRAPVEVTICFARLICSLPLPEPYVNDSGVFVLAASLGPGQISKLDSCDLGGNGNPIATTSTDSTACEIRFPNGTTQTLFLGAYEEPDTIGNYYPTVGWTISPARGVLSEHGVEAQLITSSKLTIEEQTRYPNKF